MRHRTWRILLVALALAGCLAAAFKLNHASSSVAFMGDSITYGWDFARENFGIKGQTTAEMLERFPAQVVGHGYKAVVILGGTNDTLLQLDPRTTIANLGRMIDLARSAGIEPVLCEIPPIYRDNGRFLASAETLDGRIAALAHAKHVKVVNYYEALAGHEEAFSDGTHLKRRGYARMEWALVRVFNPF